MSGHEARINDALKQLGEEFRLGMVAVEEYRSRRRMLLESWGERDATTSPGNRRTSTATTTPPVLPGRPASTAAGGSAAAPSVPRSRTWIISAAVVSVLAIAGVLYVVLVPSSPAPPATGTAAAVPSPPVEQIKKAADNFLAGNRWEQGPIDSFLTQWRALSPEDRARALDEPSLRTLKYQLSQNIRAEAQLVPANAAPEQRQRLDMLTRFAQELGG